jgi:UDP-arabinose 4-epimerase
LRYFNAAGADPDGEAGETRDVETHLIPLALDAALGRGAPLRIMGDDYPTEDGTAVRDYIHVSDLADTHVAALKYLLAGGQTFVANLGVGRGYSVREVVSAVARVTGLEVPCEFAPRRSGDPPRLVADAARARKLLGVSFRHSQGLDEIIETAWRWRSRGRPAEPSPAWRGLQRLGSARSGPDRSNGHAPTLGANPTC